MRLFVILAGLSAVLSTGALAQDQKPADSKPLVNKTGFQLRVEATGTTTKDGDLPARSTQAFTVKTARMAMSGDLTDSVSYTLRLDVKNALFEKTTAGTDTSIAALDRAYLEHRLCEGVALRIGRIPMNALSLENDYSSMDRYYESLMTTLVAYQYLPLTAGLDLSYTVAGQILSLDVFNGYTDSTTGVTVGRQKGENVSMALAWHGNLAGGIVKPIVSVDRISRVRNGDEGTPVRDQKVNFTAIGVGSEVSLSGADLDLEYDQFVKPKFKFYALDAATHAGVEKTSLDSKLATVVAQLAYNIQAVHLRPFVKFSQDGEKVDGKDTRKYKRGNLGVEFRPSTRPFRYHAVVVSKNDDDISPTATKTTKTTQYLVGVAAKL